MYDTGNIGAIQMLKPPTLDATLAEWRELGTTGTTSGRYGEAAGGPYERKSCRCDLAWLVKHWGIDERAIRSLVGGTIDCSRDIGNVVDGLLEHAPGAHNTLDDMGLIGLALASSCATGDERRRRAECARMVCALHDRGFVGAPAERRAVDELRAEHDAHLAALKQKQLAEAKREQLEASMVHTGRLKTHEADLDGLDSRDLRHVERFYEVWTCCGRGPRASGCTKPSGVP